MADKVTKTKVEKLNWKQKMEQGETLNNLQDAQADADFNYRERLINNQKRREFEARKSGVLQPSERASLDNEGNE